MEVLEGHWRSRSGTATLQHVNMLAELYMEQGSYLDARDLIEEARRLLCSDGALPMDLGVKAGKRRAGVDPKFGMAEPASFLVVQQSSLQHAYSARSGLCLAHLGRWEQAEAAMKVLLRERIDVFDDLYAAVGMELRRLGRPEL